jgi:hypothetical protein
MYTFQQSISNNNKYDKMIYIQMFKIKLLHKNENKL